jgi:hypothetical protein
VRKVGEAYMTVPLRRDHRQRPDRLFVPDKDPDYVYYWLNCSAGPQSDQNLYMAQWEGWEPAPMDPDKLPPGVLTVAGQQISQPGGTTLHRRGDLALYRMRREAWEKNIHAETEENKQRMETTLDTMVVQAQENAARALRDRGLKRIPGNLVFREDVGDPTD